MTNGKIKVLIIILDGIADRSQESLGGLTPLEAAQKPHLDQLASLSMCGLLDPIAPGVPPASDNALWSMLGYDLESYPGRSVFEAVAGEYEFEEGQVLFMANLATGTFEDEQWYVQVYPAPVKGEAARELVASLEGFNWKDLSFDIGHLGGPHFLLIPRGEASHQVTDSDPFLFQYPVRQVVPLEGASDENASRRTAEALNAFLDWARDRLSGHPLNKARTGEMKPQANLVLTKWAARVQPAESFESRWGFKGCMVASNPLQLGMATYLGMKPIRPPESTAADVNIEVSVSSALADLNREKDFALVHVKNADEVSHLGRPRLKKEVIEALDSGFGSLLDRLTQNQGLLTVITSDHTTPCGGSTNVIHGADPVPLLFLGRNIRRDRVERFDEISLATGSMGRIRGEDLMPIILDQAERSRFSSSCPWPRDLPYYPPPDRR